MPHWSGPMRLDAPSCRLRNAHAKGLLGARLAASATQDGRLGQGAQAGLDSGHCALQVGASSALPVGCSHGTGPVRWLRSRRTVRRPTPRAHSSAEEHSPYKRGVTGSNPVAPTKFVQLDDIFETLIGNPVTTAGNHRCMQSGRLAGWDLRWKRCRHAPMPMCG
jgi:hypothetical protein